MNVRKRVIAFIVAFAMVVSGMPMAAVRAEDVLNEETTSINISAKVVTGCENMGNVKVTVDGEEVTMVDPNTTVTFEAEVKEGYIFTGWYTCLLYTSDAADE